MQKLRLTPLNIISAIGLVAGVWFIIDKPGQGSPHVDVSGLIIGLCFILAIVAFISDQIFRKFIPELRNLWVIEGAFIVFTLILMFILKVSIS